jgi:hypothetical protein
MFGDIVVNQRETPNFQLLTRLFRNV